jgi:hypothetical protein
MSRHPEEQSLALYAGEDLHGPERRAIEQHLLACAQCRESVVEFRDVRSYVLASLAGPCGKDLKAVRQGVMERLPIRQPRRFFWIAAATSFTCLLLIFVASGRHPAKQVMKPIASSHKLSVVPAPSAIPAIAQNRAPKRRPRRTGLLNVELIAQADRTPVIRMNTYDPNVVILWASSERNEQ